MTARTKSKSEKPAPAASEGVTLGQALAEEGEGRTPESLTSPSKKADGPSKMDRAI